MKLSILIPCFNEIDTINQVVESVLNSAIVSKEIIVIDDFSTDGTRQILEKLYSQNKISKLVMHEKNLGKGAALKSGIKHVTGDIVIIQDADLEYDPNDYPLLIEPIINNKAEVVYGSRFKSGKAGRVLFFWHRVGNIFLTTLSNMFTNLNLTDMETCYKVFKKEIIEQIDIKEKRFGVEPEITAKISKLKCRIFEVGISYNGRTYEEGKKIGYKDGFRAIYCIIKYNILNK